MAAQHMPTATTTTDQDLAADVPTIAVDEIPEDPGDEPRRDVLAGASR